MLKLDLHVHSMYSEDGEGSPKEIIKNLKKKGISGVSITDHNTVKGSIQALKVAPKDFLVIPGIEISTSDGHLIALDVKEDIPKGHSIELTVEKIIEIGGIPIVPHLFRNMSGIKKKKLKRIIKKIDAIEVYNSCSVPQSNLKTQIVAREYKLGGTGGSDSHIPKFAGYAYTIFKIDDLDKEEILSQIKEKKTWGEGNILPTEYRSKRMTKSVKQFFERGLKRI